MRLSAQEKSLVCIYFSGSRTGTALEMRGALPYIAEQEVRAALEHTAAKMDAMNDEAFAALAGEEALL